jgi:hypothetical protein
MGITRKSKKEKVASDVMRMASHAGETARAIIRIAAVLKL